MSAAAPPITSGAGHQAALELLRAGLEDLTSSQSWERWLRFRRRFHNYSFHNQILILRQFPEATQVAGYRNWQQMGRQVRRGERGIGVLAPVVRRPAEGGAASELHDLDLPPIFFRVVRVFDVSQTDGAPLPSPVQEFCEDGPEGALADLWALAGELGFAVELTELRAGRRGDCSHALRRIRVDSRLAPGPLIKTLSHELAHAILHGPDFPGDRPLAELEAESVAFVICHHLGVDSSGYSFGYVASWAGVGQQAAMQISRSGARIAAAADRIQAAFRRDPVSSGEAGGASVS